MKNICLVRRGHLGDVILTEPIARYFKSKYDNVYLATDYIQAKCLLDGTYTDFIRINELDECKIEFESKITLTYELTPALNYIEGFANSANIVLKNKIPIVNSDWKNVVGSEYVLLAPSTSSWVYSMRNWGVENFRKLKDRIETAYKIQAIILEIKYSFTEMLYLIRHCKLLIGNDSAPGIISQCFNRNSFIIFGATHPKYVFFNKNANAIFAELDCIGCRHISRYTEIECASPLCLTELTVESVFNIISPTLNNLFNK